MIIKVAKLKKEAGLLSFTGEGIVKSLFNRGHKNLANVAQMNVGDAAKALVSSGTKAATSVGGAATAAYTHTLRGTQITADQFARLGENARMYAKPIGVSQLRIS